MQCLNCNSKLCKIEAKDCNNKKRSILRFYKNELEKNIYKNADYIVSDGKAGKLTRIEETILFIKESKYKCIAIAYCYSMENSAEKLRNLLEQNKIKTESYRCTINGIKEIELKVSVKESVNCNPIGQAKAINNSKSDFVIEMGLCLGHDVLFHKYLKKPFTVLAVKDRVLNNCPLDYFK